MGAFMKEDDIYIGTFLDLFNLRFAPMEPIGTSIGVPFGGIEEIKELQNEFKIFRRKRGFSESARLLGLGGLYNTQAKNRWFALLENLPGNGDQKIADALIANFRRKRPLPCYMRAHFSEPRSENRVIITEDDAPLFYLDRQYLTISLPMSPRKPHAKKTAKKKK